MTAQLEDSAQNWAGNLSYSAASIHHPASELELQSLVAASDSVRVLGSRHSFNTIADTTGCHISLLNMPQIFRLDKVAGTVTVNAGSSYGMLAVQLAAEGFALANLASLPHISIAGAITTATHGSGDANQNLAAAVLGLRIVDANGTIHEVSGESTPDFDGYVVGLGALGVLTEVTLSVEPHFEVAQHVYLDVPWDRVLENYDAVTSRAYSVSMFTNWAGDAVGQLWFKQRLGDGRTAEFPASFLGGSAATAAVHPLPGVPADNCTPQLGVPGAWQDRLPHFKMDFLPSAGAEIQSEYLVAREHAAESIKALRGLSEHITPILQVAEIRSVAADSLWLSASYERDSVAFHFTWIRDQAAVEAAARLIEAALAPFAARPHWGKVFAADAAELAPLYPRFEDFKALAQRMDPTGKFSNEFLQQRLFG